MGVKCAHINNINITSCSLFNTIPKFGDICRSGFVIFVCLNYSAHKKSYDEENQKTHNKNNLKLYTSRDMNNEPTITIVL